MSTPNQNNSHTSDENILAIVKKSKIFSQVDEDSCRSLLPRFEKVNLSAGEVLFEQGAPSDGLYILIEGHLIATLSGSKGKQKIIGAIERGETVGELGALSNQPRSLTVKATTECMLLKLTRLQFEDFAKQHPAVMFYMIDLIISRSQNTIRLFSRKRIYKHIAVISGHSFAPIAKFMATLKANTHLHPEVVLLEDVSAAANLSQLIDDAENNGQTLIFHLKPENLLSLEDRFNHIGEIFVVVNAEHQTPFSTFALELLGAGKMPVAAQPELVILHPNEAEPPKNTIYWLNQANFTLHHHLLIDDNLDYQRILRIMTGKAIGLVLGGGGNKGWVSMGALKALLEANIPIDIIGGTSVGALVGACYAMSFSYDKTFEIFESLTAATNNPFSLRDFTWPIISLLSSRRPTEALQKAFKDTRMEDLWLPFFSVTCNLSTGKEMVHTDGELWTRLRASMAIPGVVPPMVIDGELYVDGGIVNNLPVDHMRLAIGTESTIIAISLADMIESKERYNFPPVIPFRVGLLKKLRLGYHDYRFPPYFNTFMNALLIGSSSKEKTHRLSADILISPHLSNYRAFNITTKGISALVEIGYKAAKEKLAEQNLFS